MTVDLKQYRDNLEQPWGKIQYEITFAQLAHLKDQNILDFGSGFGLTSAFLAQNNQVTSIEPNKDMLEWNDEASYQKMLGSLDELTLLKDHSFDVVICHNVLEYIKVENRKNYIDAFKRLLKPQGLLSIIKHNHVGKVLQTVVLENNIPKALQLLDGQDFESVSFAQGWTYSIDDLLELSEMPLEKYQAIRTFYSLQTNDLKTADDWLKEMTEIELAVCDLKPYKDISFLQHVWLRNN